MKADEVPSATPTDGAPTLLVTKYASGMQESSVSYLVLSMIKLIPMQKEIYLQFCS